MKWKRLRYQVRQSLQDALGMALSVALPICIMGVLGGVWDLVTASEPEPQLRLYIAVAIIISTLMAAVVFVSSLTDWRRRDRLRSSHSPAFRGQAFYRGLYATVGTGALLLSFRLYQQGEGPWLPLIPCVFSMISWYGWPCTIRCTDTGIYQRNRFGRLYYIPYTSVEYIASDGLGNTSVSDGVSTIEHTLHHEHADLFQRIVSRKSGKPVY